MMDFLYMGGYWPWVWGSYGMMVGVIAIEVAQLRFRRRHLMQWLRRMARLAREGEQ